MIIKETVLSLIHTYVSTDENLSLGRKTIFGMFKD